MLPGFSMNDEMVAEENFLLLQQWIMSVCSFFTGVILKEKRSLITGKTSILLQE